jgi:hypothetical protein
MWLQLIDRLALAPIAHGISITRREAQGKCGDFCLLLPALCLDTAHSQKTKIPTFFLALTPLITKFRERWGLDVPYKLVL